MITGWPNTYGLLKNRTLYVHYKLVDEFVFLLKHIDVKKTVDGIGIDRSSHHEVHVRCNQEFLMEILSEQWRQSHKHIQTHLFGSND